MAPILWSYSQWHLGNNWVVCPSFAWVYLLYACWSCRTPKFLFSLSLFPPIFFRKRWTYTGRGTYIYIERERERERELAFPPSSTFMKQRAYQKQLGGYNSMPLNVWILAIQWLTTFSKDCGGWYIIITSQNQPAVPIFAPKNIGPGYIFVCICVCIYMYACAVCTACCQLGERCSWVLIMYESIC